MSADLESRLALEDDLPAVVEALAQHGGKVVQDQTNPLLYWIDLAARSDGQRFVARIEWFVYPHEPASVRFVSEVGSATGVKTDWPTCPGYRPDSSDICRAFTHEGYNTHPEWRGGPEAWSPEGNKFLYVAMEIQNDLNYQYSGRTA